MNFKIKKIDYETAREYGEWDNAGRWYPDDEFRVPGSFEVRTPSRAYPTSYFKHFLTLKYARMLARNKPDLYLEIQGINKDNEEGKGIIAWAVKQKLMKEE